MISYALLPITLFCSSLQSKFSELSTLPISLFFLSIYSPADCNLCCAPSLGHPNYSLFKVTNNIKLMLQPMTTFQSLLSFLIPQEHLTMSSVPSSKKQSSLYFMIPQLCFSALLLAVCSVSFVAPHPMLVP